MNDLHVVYKISHSMLTLSRALFRGGGEWATCLLGIKVNIQIGEEVCRFYFQLCVLLKFSIFLHAIAILQTRDGITGKST